MLVLTRLTQVVFNNLIACKYREAQPLKNNYFLSNKHSPLRDS